MREKLIELLGNVYLPMTCGPNTIGEYRIPHKFKKELADHLIANGVVISNSETTTKWIPVTERLPEGECLAVSMRNGHSYKEMLVGYVYADAYSDTLYTAESDGEILKNVTHWMELPEPPKGE